MPSISVASYNVLNPYHAVKWADAEGLNEKGLLKPVKKLRASALSEKSWRSYSNWEERKERLRANLVLADIVCLQEIAHETIVSLLPAGYGLACAAYHKADQKYKEYGNAIIYRQDAAFKVASFECRWTYEKSDRAAACAVFALGNYSILVASIHLTGYDPEESRREKMQEAKKRGYLELAAYVEQLEDAATRLDGIVIAGDLNEDPGESAAPLYRMGYLAERGFRSDHNLLPSEPAKQRKIDWIFYKPLQQKLPAVLEPLSLETTQLHASDHLMTGTRMIFI